MTNAVAAENTVEILRPIGEVFAFFADAENDPRWRSGVKSIHRVGDPGQGARYEQVVAGPGGRAISADILVTVFEPGKRIAFETTTGPVRPRGNYTFQEVPDGTRVTFALTAELTGIKAMLMTGAVRRTMDAEVAALTNAKQHLESQSR
jgi:uncharacterized membrane protein